MYGYDNAPMPVTAPVQGTYCHGGYPYAGVAGVGYGGGFALIVVLFILLIIIGAVCWTW